MEAPDTVRPDSELIARRRVAGAATIVPGAAVWMLTRP